MKYLANKSKIALITAMENSADLTAVVPVDRIFGSAPNDLPQSPFIRIGYIDAEPYEDSCGEGTTCEATIQGFSDTEGEAGVLARLVSEAVDDLPEAMACDVTRVTVVPQTTAPKWRTLVFVTITQTE